MAANFTRRIPINVAIPILRVRRVGCATANDLRYFPQLSLLPVSAESRESQSWLCFAFAWENELQIGLFFLPEEGFLSLGGGDKGIKG